MRFLRRLPLFPSAAAGTLRRLCTAATRLKTLAPSPRRAALTAARLALTDYLHSTRALPFTHSSLIAAHSPHSLSSLLAALPFPASAPPSDLPLLLRRHLSYHPLSEFDFLFESIGLPPDHPRPRALFLSDLPPLLPSLSSLSSFGFPWTALGALYSHNPHFFHSTNSSVSVTTALSALEQRGLPRQCVIASCLTFPCLLSSANTLLSDDLTKLFVGFGIADKDNQHDADYFLRVCHRVKVLYGVGIAEGAFSELTGVDRKVFLEIKEEEVVRKVRFLTDLGMEGAGLFLLRNKEMGDVDLDTTITMPGYLERIGLDEEEAALLVGKYPYVMGKNKLENLPGALRAMGLLEWFRRRAGVGNVECFLQGCTGIDCSDREMEDDFLKVMAKVRSLKKKDECLDYKLEFLLGIGYGENTITARTVGLINSTREQLQERFNCLLGWGVEYTMLCRLISTGPKFLNQNIEWLQEKMKYLCEDLGLSVEYLNTFPSYLNYDLENRTRPRYNILNWLKGKRPVEQRF